MAPRSPCAAIWAPKELSYFTAAVSGLLSIVTTGGNTLVCFAVFKDPYKKLRTPFMYFLVNLAVSDLLVGCVTMPTSVVTHTLEANKTKKNFHVRIILVNAEFETTLICCSSERFKFTNMKISQVTCHTCKL